MMLCEGSVYNLTYAYRNGTYNVLSKSLADTDLSWLMTAPMVVGSALPFPVKAVAAAMDLATSAATAKANSVSDLETFFAEGISQVGIAFASGVFNEAPSLQESLLYMMIVSRIPLSVCWFFIGLSLLYGIVGVVLGCFAFLLSSNEVADVAEYLANISTTLENEFGKDKHFRVARKGKEGHLYLESSTRTMPPAEMPAYWSRRTGGAPLSRSSSQQELLDSS